MDRPSYSLHEESLNLNQVSCSCILRDLMAGFGLNLRRTVNKPKVHETTAVPYGRVSDI